MRYIALGSPVMDCHECARTGTELTAVAVCRFCSVALCKDHLVEAFHGRTVPQYGCDHHPERPFPPVIVIVPVSAAPRTHRAA